MNKILKLNKVIESINNLEQVAPTRQWINKMKLDDLKKLDLMLSLSIKRNKLFFKLIGKEY